MAALELQQVSLPSELPALAAAELRQEEAPGLQVRLHRRASPPFVLERRKTEMILNRIVRTHIYLQHLRSTIIQIKKKENISPFSNWAADF